MTVHIIGMGVSGLSAAFTLTQAGLPVVLYDAAARAGGRCHSFFDGRLDARIDNGSHLMLGANTALLEMLAQCPCETPLKNAGNQILFLNKNGESFQINTARPITALRKLPALYSLLCESVMNTPVHQVDTFLFLKTALKCFGEKNGQIYLADPSLYDCVIAPVERFLKHKNVSLHFGKRLRRIKEKSLIFFDGETINLQQNDRVILATDPQNLSRLVVGASELPYQTIVNIHYRTDACLPDGYSFAGLIGLTGHWIFIKNGILSVTISAANALLEKFSPDSAASLVWHELSALLNLGVDLPEYRVIAEKRATILQTRAINRRRLEADIGSDIVFLAGDATATGLPCTIEGSVRSGIKAAQLILKSINKRSLYFFF